MPASERLADTPRSSPQSQRRKAGANALLDSPAPKFYAEEIRTPTKFKSRQANGTGASVIPQSSRKRVSAEAAVVEEMLLTQAEREART